MEQTARLVILDAMSLVQNDSIPSDLEEWAEFLRESLLESTVIPSPLALQL
jgi:hypothetical protein